MRYTPMAVAAVVTLAAFLRLGPRLGLLVGVLALGAVAIVVPALERRRVMALARSLSRRRLFGALGAPGGEKALLERLLKSLESPEPSEVLYAVDLLGKLGQPPDADRRKTLLEHPSAEVRRAMVEGAAALPPLRDAVRRLLEQDPSPDVRAAAARELGAAGDITDLDALAPLLNPRFPAVREGALAGLLASRSVEAATLGVAELERLQASASRDDRAAAAKLLGRVGDPRFLPQLEALLDDRDPEVRKHALESAASYSSPKSSARLAPLLLKALSETRTAASAASALSAHGAAVVQKLAELYASATTSEDTTRRILSITRRIGGASSERFLWDVAERGPIDPRCLALRALVASSARADSRARSSLRAGVEKELDAALWVLAARRDLESEEPEGSLLMASLDREIALFQERLRHMLSLLGIEVDEAAIAQELEALFGLEAAKGLSALLSRGSAAPAEAVNALRAVYPERLMSRVERLRAIVTRSAWLGGFTRATALYRLAEIGDPEIPNVVAEGLSDASPFVRETAVWAAGRANGGTPGLEGLIAKARDDEAELVSRIAREVELGATVRPRP